MRKHGEQSKAMVEEEKGGQAYPEDQGSIHVRCMVFSDNLDQ